MGFLPSLSPNKNPILGNLANFLTINRFSRDGYGHFIQMTKRGFSPVAKKEAAPAPLPEELSVKPSEEFSVKRSEELSRKISDLHEHADHLDKEITRIRKEVAAAVKAKKQVKAEQLVTQCKKLEKEQEQTWAKAANLQAMLDQIQSAVMNIDAVKALEENNKIIKALMAQHGINTERIDEIQDEAAGMVEAFDEVPRSASTPIDAELEGGHHKQRPVAVADDDMAALLAEFA
jgi:hypothetical protein